MLSHNFLIMDNLYVADLLKTWFFVKNIIFLVTVITPLVSDQIIFCCCWNGSSQQWDCDQQQVRVCVHLQCFLNHSHDRHIYLHNHLIIFPRGHWNRQISLGSLLHSPNSQWYAVDHKNRLILDCVIQSYLTSVTW